MPAKLALLYLLPLLALAAGLHGCGAFKSGAGGPATRTDTLRAGFTALDSSVAGRTHPRGADISPPAAEAWTGYAGRTITTLSGPLVRPNRPPQGKDRGTAAPRSRDRAIMGNLAADAIRVTASATFGRRVDLALLPTGLIRATFSDSAVTRADVMRMVPLDEELITVQMSGQEIGRIAAHIAGEGGIAISGMRMRVRDGRPADILIQASSPGSAETYEVCMPYSFRHSAAMEEALTGGEATGPNTGATATVSSPGAESGQSYFRPGGRPTHRLNTTLQAAVMQYLEDRPRLHPIRDGRLRNRLSGQNLR